MDLTHRKTILRKISTGLYIVTGNTKSGPVAAAISFLTQTSMDPPLVTMAIRSDSSLYQAVQPGNYLAIHFPATDQQDMVGSFFRIKDSDENSINGYEFTLSDLGNPILIDTPMALEVVVKQIIPEGDHHVIITEVVHTLLKEDKDILAMHHTTWHYGG